MQVTLPFGFEEVTFRLPAAENRVQVARSKNLRTGRSFEDLTREALAQPTGSLRLSALARKRGGKAVVMVDDKLRPTPAYRVLPAVLDELQKGGLHPRDITIVTGTGLHEVMTEEELAKKVGDETLARYRVLPHNPHDKEQQAFMGFSNLGSPIWINEAVAEASVKVSVGRVAPHGDAGYEGGAKMIVPGVASLETVMHNHAMFLSAKAGIGTLDSNPGRRDMDDIGGKVGLDFLVNFVVGSDGEPVKGFAGHYLRAHRAAVAYGDEQVWAAEIGCKADVTIASPGRVSSKPRGVDWRMLANAKRGTKPGGTIVLLCGEEEPQSEDEARARTPPLMYELANSSLETVVQRMERREWRTPEDWLHIMRASAGKARYYYHRVLLAGGKASPRTLRGLNAEHRESLEEAVREALNRAGGKPRVLILPEATTTLPLEHYHKEAL
ncbi:MAG: lactate racemase domain-containing protein [Candidatus Bathyarchaeia archaeon]